MHIVNGDDPRDVVGDIDASGTFHFTGDVTFEQLAGMFPTARYEIHEFRQDERGQRFVVAGRILTFATGGRPPHAPEVVLSNGSVVVHRTLGLGVQQAFVVRGRDGQMKPAEMAEYNRITAARANAH